MVEALESLFEDPGGISDVSDSPLRYVLHREGDVRSYQDSFVLWIHMAPLRSFGGELPGGSLLPNGPSEEGYRQKVHVLAGGDRSAFKIS